MTNTELNRIYVASLSDYNDGIPHGDWITLNDFSSVDEVWEAINSMLAASPTARAEGVPAEEWAIHAYEGFAELTVSQTEDIDTLWYAHELLGTLDDMEYEAFSEWLPWARSGNVSDVTHENLEDFRDAFCGRYESERAYAEELVSDMGVLDNCGNELLSSYFDYDALARDLFCTDYYMSFSGFVFRYQ